MMTYSNFITGFSGKQMQVNVYPFDAFTQNEKRFKTGVH